MKYIKKIIINSDQFNDFCKKNKKIEIEFLEIGDLDEIDPFLEENKNFIINSKIKNISYRVLLFNEKEKFLSKEEIKKLEDIISKDPYYSYLYAREVIKGPWKEGEDSISKDTQSAVLYMGHVIKGRWEKGEDAIAKDAQEAYFYAKDVIKGRFLKAEDLISQDRYFAPLYAENIIKGPWPK